MAGEDIQGLIRSYRRDQLVTTALKIFGRSGSLDVSMDEIAVEAGLSRSTLYNHFQDRAELLAACAEWSASKVARSMQEALGHDADLPAVVAGFFQAVFMCLDENPGFYRLATTLRSSSDDAEAALHLELTAATTASRRQIDALVSRLHSSATVDTEPADTLSWVQLVLVGALQQRATTNQPPPSDAAGRWVAELLLNGLVRR